MLISIVFNLHTTGPILLRAVKSQDMHLAGSITMLLSSELGKFRIFLHKKLYIDID